MAKETREKAEIGPYETIERRGLRRRAFLKTGVYGLAGATAGDVYHKIMDFLGWTGRKIGEVEKQYVGNRAKGDQAYLEKTKRLEKSDTPGAKESAKVRRTTDKVENWRSRLFRKVIGRTDEDARQAREKRGIGEYAPSYKPQDSSSTLYPGQKSPAAKTSIQVTKEEPPAPVDRRGFFSELLGLAHRNPRTAGLVIGATVGGVKAARNYDPKGKIPAARALDVQVRGHGVTKENTAAVRELTDTLRETHQPKKPKGDTRDPEYTMGLFTVGIIGIILSVIISSVQITGFSIANASESSLKIGSIVIFLISLMLILISRVIK